MPSKTPEQKKFMQAVANNPKFAKKVKVPVKVGKEFVKADKAEGAKMKSYRDGGIYTADMGEPPQDIDGGSAPKKKPALKRLTPKQSEAARDEAKKRFSEMPRGTTRKLTKDDLILTSKDKASFRKGGSIDGIAKRGKTNCKMR
jgi:hypothetical protein